MDEPASTVFLRPLGTPVALGLSGLVTGSLVASGLELGWVAETQRPHAAIAFIAFSFPLQALATVLAFLARDAAVGTAMGILSATWLATGLEYLASPPGTVSGALGLLLLASGCLLAGAAAGVARSKRLPAAVFATEALRFVLVGIYELSGNHFWQDFGGIVGLAVVALAGSAMLSVLLTSAPGEPEPGVRPQL